MDDDNASSYNDLRGFTGLLSSNGSLRYAISLIFVSFFLSKIASLFAFLGKEICISTHQL
jgi:hypothetical protein